MIAIWFLHQITSKVGVEIESVDDAQQCYINVDPGNSDESDILMEYDSEHDSDLETNREQAAWTDISNLEQQENEYALAFNSYKRIQCFIHALQLTVKIFETAPSFKARLIA